jgi:hypothetical protein
MSCMVADSLSLAGALLSESLAVLALACYILLCLHVMVILPRHVSPPEPLDRASQWEQPPRRTAEPQLGAAAVHPGGDMTAEREYVIQKSEKLGSMLKGHPYHPADAHRGSNRHNPDLPLLSCYGPVDLQRPIQTLESMVPSFQACLET